MPADPSARERFLTTTEIVAEARARLSDEVWDYICGGAETETTLLRNRYSLDAIAFRPRVLRNVDKVDAATTAFGARRRLPVLLAPLGGMTVFHEAGAIPSAEAAREFGCLMMLSSVTEPGLAQVAPAAGEQLIFQLYVHGDDRWVGERVEKAVAAGVQAFCVTVDVPHYGRRERSLLRRFQLPGRPFAGLRTGEEYAMRLDWNVVDNLKRRLGKVPLILKGVATADDATLALDHGVDAIYVSNHGGRQLDHGRGAMDILPEIVAAVRGKATVIVDGGFMRGTDVLKAIAMGADLIGIGRLQALAVAAGGRDGVLRMLELIEAEIEVAMKLLGASKLADLDGNFLHPSIPTSPPRALGALPLLDEIPSR
jgi:isopentenyl diphosphate isomerase/L-lactate dehydrogenase-like FMN-dependent dehydrogenase